MIMSFIVSVIILMDDCQCLFAIGKKTTNVCGAIRKKCAVEPGNRVRTINHIKNLYIPLYHPRRPSVLNVFHRQSIGFL